MKVLFVASGNSQNFDVAPFIRAQGDSISQEGVEVQYFKVLGKGTIGYLKAIRSLRAFIKNGNFDLIHTHYTLAGLVGVLAFSGKPIVHSFMGSDVYGIYTGENKVKLSSRYLTLLSWVIQPFVHAIISKSSNINKYVYLRRKAEIIPNGVDLESISRIDVEPKKALGLDPEKCHILFLGNPGSPRKNFDLVKNAVDLLSDQNIELLAPYPIPHEQVLKYLRVIDVFAMTAFMEGSPNVVKEAMACNCPIVSTKVGDVEWVIGQTKGCFLSSFDPAEFAERLQAALLFSKEKARTDGADRVRELGLDSKTVARRIIGTYEKCLARN